MSGVPIPESGEPAPPQSEERRPPPLQRAESFRALSELLRWAYESPPGASDPPSTQAEVDHSGSRRGPEFDATEWEEKAAPRFAAPGERIGRFTIVAELGRGGFGIVYLAVDTRLGREVALKVPRPDRVQNAAIWGRFAREARLAASLDHEAIVPVLDAGLIEGTFYLATAYQHGEPLSRWLARHPDGIAPRAAAETAARLAAGLAYAHGRGVLHRDLKPGNVLMVRPSGAADGGGAEPLPLPRITDFGLGTFHDEDDSGTLTGFWLGTPPYMAPEQVLADLGPVDARADVYALGAILYELLTGRPIHDCRTIWALSVALGRGDPPIRPRQIRRGVPRDLETICLKCLDYSPARRYQSAAELCDDLNRFLLGVPVSARPRPAWVRLGLWARRHPSRAGLLGGVAAASLMIAGLTARHQASLSTSNSRLNVANRELEATVAKLESTMQELHATELAERRTSYAANLRLAAQEIQEGQVALAQSVLRRLRPNPDEVDLREFTWGFLHRRATQAYEVVPLYDFTWWKRTHPRDGAAPSWKWIDHLLSGDVVFDPLGIGSSGYTETSLYNSGYSRFFIAAGGDRDADSLWYDDGRREIRVKLPPARPALSLDGRSLALSDQAWFAAVGDAPELKIRLLGPDAADPAEPPAGPPADLRVIEAPAALSLSFSRDGRTLALQARTNEPRLVPIVYDLESSRRASFPAQAHDPEVGRNLPAGANMRDRGLLAKMVVSPDGRLAARSDWSPRIVAFDARSGDRRWIVEPSAFDPAAVVTCLAFSPDGASLVTGDCAGDVRVWNAADGAFRARFPRNLEFVKAVGWYPDSQTVAIIAAGEDAVHFWKFAPEPPPPDVMDHGDEVWDLAFLGGGAALASAGDDNRIRLWNPATCKPLKTIENPGNLVSVLAVGARGDRLYSGDFNGRIIEYPILQDGATGEPSELGPPLFGNRPIRSMAGSPDGRYLAATSRSTTLWIRDLVERSDQSIATPQIENLHGVAFSPDGRTLAVGSDDDSITLWDVPGFKHRATLPTRGQIRSLSFSPDSNQIAAGDNEGRIQVWRRSGTSYDPAGTVERATETGGVWDLAYHPDGRTLASGGDDGTVRLWDPESLHELAKFTEHAAKVHAVAFSPDGRTLASADFLGVVRIHRAGPAED